MQIDLTYVPQISNSTGWLDYIEINTERELNFVGPQMLFTNCEGNNARDIKYVIDNVNLNQSIWDITNKTDETFEMIKYYFHIKNYNMITKIL